MKLCINPACQCHCDIKLDDEKVWRFASGFQTAVSKQLIANFDPESDDNLCPFCEGVISLLIGFKLLNNFNVCPHAAELRRE
jgi:hypothetical protein